MSVITMMCECPVPLAHLMFREDGMILATLVIIDEDSADAHAQIAVILQATRSTVMCPKCKREYSHIRFDDQEQP